MLPSGYTDHMKIVLIGSPILRKKAQPIRKMTRELVHLAKSMEDVMKPTGVGLAAPQIGLSQAFFIYNVGEGLHLVANPQILERKGSASAEEGCLSVPGVYAPIDRATEITLSYLDHTGKRRVHKFLDFEARVIQHEFDHLQGMLFVDRITDPSTISVQEGSPVAAALTQTVEGKGQQL
ncbi:peptide deformylase [Candidatus Cryosericum terrychapinii]|uniref:Peptide deformylase n=2 Tax=Candidatus Cryosericum terrychapinii TaxID=2290919 RepID=A0A398CU80_9BACT|nr:peptide deformylase [Candidatus Cryosericum terrychapinii]